MYTTGRKELFHPEYRTMFERITFDKDIMGGRACIRGMCIPVSLTVNLATNGMPTNEIMQKYPSLEVEDIEDALEYAHSA